MTTNDERTQPALAGIIPRWEWRTFGGLEDENDLLASLRDLVPAESEETYFVSLHGDASVKVRAGLLDIKVLQRVSRTGLQLWVPTTKASFPVDADAVTALYAALGVTPESTAQTTGRPGLAYEELVAEVVGSRDDVRAVAVSKSRHRSEIDGCMVEYTVLTADGRTTRTVAVESPDQDLVLRTISALGLEGRANTCVAQGVKALLGWQAPRYAVLDIGTNSIKFTVGQRRADVAPGVAVDTAVVTRLGEGVAETGELSEAAMSRTVDAVAGLVEDALRDGPIEIAAVGTAGLRQAGNTEAFLVAVLARTGISIEVISGPEEARLAYLAAVSSLPLSGDRLLVFDSGGGSSQFTFGSRTSIDEQFSLDVGAVRYAERFGLTQAVDRATVDDALAAITQDLASVAGRPRPDMVIAIGGTSTNLAAVSHGLATYDPDVVHGSRVDLAEIDRQIELYRQRSADERREIPGLQAARAEVILAGACIVRTILTTTGQEAVTVSDRGLRHGVVAERFSG